MLFDLGRSARNHGCLRKITGHSADDVGGANSRTTWTTRQTRLPGLTTVEGRCGATFGRRRVLQAGRSQTRFVAEFACASGASTTADRYGQEPHRISLRGAAELIAGSAARYPPRTPAQSHLSMCGVCRRLRPGSRRYRPVHRDGTQSRVQKPSVRLCEQQTLCRPE